MFIKNQKKQIDNIDDIDRRLIEYGIITQTKANNRLKALKEAKAKPKTESTEEAVQE